jgi:hypothetical protein
MCGAPLGALGRSSSVERRSAHEACERGRKREEEREKRRKEARDSDGRNGRNGDKALRGAGVRASSGLLLRLLAALSALKRG